MLTLLILAAGESSRMGRPKALLKISDETFTECIVRKANLAGIHSILVITGADHEVIKKALSTGIHCVKNENFAQGQISSFQKGIQELQTGVTETIIWPVDQPLVKSETVKQIVATHHQGKKALTIPVYQGRKGHPVLYGIKAMQAALNLGANQTGKDLQSMFVNDIAWMETEDAGIITDIDTPEDYEKYIKPLKRVSS